MQIESFFDPNTFTLTYVVFDRRTRDALVIDPVLDYDPASSTYHFASIQKIEDYLRKNELRPHAILETHAHADHLTGSQELKRRFPRARIGIGERITEVQKVFKDLFHFPEEFPVDGSQFDFLLNEKEIFRAGSLSVKTLFTPGHTPACASYMIGDAVFTGDALFMPDYGTGRCDFPRGSSDALFRSIHEKLYALPDDTRVFTGHDYQPGGRPLRFESTIGEEKRNNIQLKAETTREQFVRFRTERDKTLSAPRLLLPSIQVNIAAGCFPPPESNGVSYLKFPLLSKDEKAAKKSGGETQ